MIGDLRFPEACGTTHQTWPSSANRRKTWLWRIGVILAGQFGMHHSLIAQSTTGDPVKDAWGDQEQVRKCAECHFSLPQGLPTGPRVTEFSSRKEAGIWFTQDKHAIARRRIEPLSAEQIDLELRALRKSHQNFARAGDLEQWVGPSNQLSREICDRLGFNVTTKEGYHEFRDNCLTCHGGYSVTVASHAQSFAQGGTQPGISCNYCHQLGEQEAWVADHGLDLERDWRMKSPEAKAALGMRDLVDVEAQSRLCLNCHIGNLGEGKFVTHAMYSAGHPPLPAFEPRTFCRAMPQHWRTPTELYQALARDPARDAYFEINYSGLAEAQVERAGATVDWQGIHWNTRQILLGTLVARRHWLELIDEAASREETWGDYALYDCGACHHELRRPSHRQERGYVGAPGRPRFAEWPTGLLNLAARQAAGAERIAHSELELHLAFTNVPFGDPQACGSAARAGIHEISTAIKILAARPIDWKVAQTVLRELSHPPVSGLVDYHTARQWVWALREVASEVHRSRPLSEPVRVAIDQLGDGTPEHSGILATLPSGRARFIYPDYLREELARRADYAPDQLERQLAKLHEQLESELSLVKGQP